MILLNFYEWKDFDGYSWRWEKLGLFSVKSFDRFLIDGGVTCPYYKIIWKVIALLKVRLQLWLLIHNGLLTGERLHRRNVIGSQSCLICNLVEDSFAHIF